MKLSEILNNTTGSDQMPEEDPESALGTRELIRDQAIPKRTDGEATMTGIGEETNSSVKNFASSTAPSVPQPTAKAPTGLSQHPPSLPSSLSTAQLLSAMERPGNYSEDTPMQAPKPTLPALLPPVPQQNARIRLRPDVDTSSRVHNPIKRARRNTADRSAHSDYDEGDDSPPQGSQSDHAQWAQHAPPMAPRKQPLTSEPTLLIESGESHEPHWKQKIQRAVSRSNSIYPEPTQASISSAGSSAWHSHLYRLKFRKLLLYCRMKRWRLPKFGVLPPPPPALRRSSAPKPLPTASMVPPPAPALFRRRTASATPTPTSATSFASSPLASSGSLPNVGIQSATDLLSQPQVKVALQRHKELSMRAVQEQIGGTWAPRGELKVMFGDGAPANLLRRYSAKEILDSASWGDAGNGQRLWFQVRPEMKGAQEVTTTMSLRKTKSERIDEGWVEVDEVQQKMDEDEADGEMVSVSNRSIHHSSGERLISASKELMVKQLFPKYEPSIQGLPQGHIYLRHDHDRFEYRPHGWGERPDHDTTGGPPPPTSSPTKTEAQYLALIRTPGGGTPGPRYIPPANRRLLQWSLAQARWIFVLNELPTKERPKRDEGYPTPDRTNSFLQQGEIVRRLDVTPNSEGEWEWVLPIRSKLWVSPMDKIVKKHGDLAAPIWDLGGRMLWDARVGQWRFDVCPPTKEVREVVSDLNGVSSEVVYDVCDGGRPRISWDHFIAAREYLLVLQRKIVKLKGRARERKGVRTVSNDAISAPFNSNNHHQQSSNTLLVPDPIKIKKEEDIESAYSDSGIEPEPSVLSSSVASISDDHQSVSSRSGGNGDDGLSQHRQQCASLLLNMMLSVAKAPPSSQVAATGSSSSTGITIQVKNVEEAMQEAVQDNAMSLDLGLHGSGSASSISRSKLTINPALRKNNGFGEIGSISPSISPTASHASTHRSMSVEDDPDSPSNA
ncbi:SubName: Full=Uncharacterized protein {ECO:0000313/EMBL:CCA70709.1} [Serendipita indica DSM 11827]|nr:SubName: Full=Uncharacterized protein {ECO:0000313/EMBL:CCA70709.1} [Serendipita indica DSM 11827]